jgi:CheY-like chemotaxis protein
VVLLDIGLPGVDGYEIARRLRRARGFESLTLVAVSGYGQDEARGGHQDYGFDFHLVKPVETAELWKIFDAIPAR